MIGEQLLNFQMLDLRHKQTFGFKFVDKKSDTYNFLLTLVLGT